MSSTCAIREICRPAVLSITEKSIAPSGTEKETDVFTKLLTQAGGAATAKFPRVPGMRMQELLHVCPSYQPLPCSRHRRLPLRRPAAPSGFFRTTH